MHMTVFQKLVLHALALCLWHFGEKSAARTMRAYASGRVGDSETLDDWWDKERCVGRKGLDE